MRLFGIKNNKCLLGGVQGVCKTVTRTGSGQGAFFGIDNPENNTLYVCKEFPAGGLFGLIPEDPTGDYNFKLTLQSSSGFLGQLAALLKFYHASISGSGPEITIEWDNPSFNPMSSYTVIHVHIWHDGINFCGHIDGYV